MGFSAVVEGGPNPVLLLLPPSSVLAALCFAEPAVQGHTASVLFLLIFFNNYRQIGI